MMNFQSKLRQDYKVCRRLGMSHYAALGQVAAANVVTSSAVCDALYRPFTTEDWRDLPDTDDAGNGV